MSSYRGRSEAGKQPARVGAARERSAIGDLVRENWPIDPRELAALGDLDRCRLGDLHDELVAAREHHGQELEGAQREVHRHRVLRKALRQVLAPKYSRKSDLDWALNRLPEHEAVHQSELRWVARARQLHGLIIQLNGALANVLGEMKRRIGKGGFKALPGHERMFNTEVAKYRRRKRVWMRKNLARLMSRATS